MDHPVVYRLVRSASTRHGLHSHGSALAPFTFLYLTVASAVTTFVKVAHSLSAVGAPGYSLPMLNSTMEFLDMLVESVLLTMGNHSLGRPFSLPALEPDPGWWFETTRIELETWHSRFLILYGMQTDANKELLLSYIAAAATALEAARAFDDAPIWTDLLVWVMSLRSLQVQIEWDDVSIHEVPRASMPSSSSG